MGQYWVLKETSDLPARISVPGDVVDASNYFSCRTDITYPVYIEDGVQNASNMFNGCTTFNYDVSIPVTISNCDKMFFNCESFNKAIKIPNTHASCKDMFDGCKAMNSNVYCTELQFEESGLKKLAYRYDAKNYVAYFKKQPQKEINWEWRNALLESLPVVKEIEKSSKETDYFSR